MIFLKIKLNLKNLKTVLNSQMIYISKFECVNAYFTPIQFSNNIYAYLRKLLFYNERLASSLNLQVYKLNYLNVFCLCAFQKRLFYSYVAAFICTNCIFIFLLNILDIVQQKKFTNFTFERFKIGCHIKLIDQKVS